MESVASRDTGGLDNTTLHQQHEINHLNQTKCQYENIKIIQSLISLDAIINNQAKPISPKNDGKQILKWKSQ